MNEESKQNQAVNEPGFVSTFGNGGFWELYKDLERQFEDFLNYVPYLDGNEKTYSYRLFNLLLGIGGYIDSAFKEMARFPKFSEDRDCQLILERARNKQGIFDSAINAFGRIYPILGGKVIFKRIPEREFTTPFSEPQEWWTYYNNVKHEISFNLKDANLKNT